MKNLIKEFSFTIAIMLLVSGILDFISGTIWTILIIFSGKSSQGMAYTLASLGLIKLGLAIIAANSNGGSK